jgi:hypothetical protein
MPCSSICTGFQDYILLFSYIISIWHNDDFYKCYKFSIRGQWIMSKFEIYHHYPIDLILGLHCTCLVDFCRTSDGDY